MPLISIVWLVLACSNPKADNQSSVVSDAPDLIDAHNFTYQANIDIGVKSLPPGEDSFISWEGISVDMLGHAYDPQAVTRATMVVFGGLSETELESSIANNELDQSNVRLLVACTPLDLGCYLSEFTMLGTDVDLEERFQPEEGLWLVALSTEGSESQYSKLMLVQPDSTAADNQIEFEDNDSLFEVSANLSEAQTVDVPSDAVVDFDWSGLTRDGLNNELALHRIDRIDIARYSNRSLADLEAQFLDIDIMADARWSADVEGHQSFSTSQLDDFGGFTEGDLWMLALRCMSCGTPMPLFLANLTPQPVQD